MKSALTIAGFDPSGGAGLQADLKVFYDHGLRGFSAATALTVQDMARVSAVKPVSASLVTDQINALAEACRIDAIKIGMLASISMARAVRQALKKLDCPVVVLDPVVRSSSGFALMEEGGVEAIKELFPLVTAITPNLDEAAALCNRPVRTIKDMKEAAKRLNGLGARCVVVTGGHLKKSAVDVLYVDNEYRYFEGKRIPGEQKRFHGTGCLFSSALAAGLANGQAVAPAVANAKKYVARVISRER
jgi:hydroxymethylpyrimidine/phosphomethylpyrimidine kinase